MSEEDKTQSQVEVNPKDSTESNKVVERDSSLDPLEHDEKNPKHYTQSEIAASGKWYDRRLIPGLPSYSNSMVQIVMVAFVIFMTPGMYNALTGIGASITNPNNPDAGKYAQNNSYVALYTVFAVVGFFAGSVCNIIGAKACLIFGGTGYAVYSGSLLSYQHNYNTGFVIFAGAYLGVCASCLWAAQGSIIMSYPTEDKKGTGIMIFWMIFNFGAVIGAIIPLANNLHSTNSSVNDGTYIAFLVLMISGIVIAAFTLQPKKVWKSDGTKIPDQRYPSWQHEILGCFFTIKDEPWILFLFPLFFSSNWFYTYQFNEFNAGRFNVRTRSLNSLLYWLFQMIGAAVMGVLLDLKFVNRRYRARLGWLVLFVITFPIWGGGYKFQKSYTRADVNPEDPKIKLMDFKDSGYVGPMFLYIFYGIYDAMFQTYCLWIMGALSNSLKKTAYYAGFYKGLQSAGAAVGWAIDSRGIKYMSFLISCWAMCAGSLLVALPVIIWRVKDHTEEENVDDILDDPDMEPVVALASGEGRVV